MFQTFIIEKNMIEQIIEKNNNADGEIRSKIQPCFDLAEIKNRNLPAR